MTVKAGVRLAAILLCAAGAIAAGWLSMGCNARQADSAAMQAGDGYGDALINAQERARRLKCQSNLRQIGTAITEYSAEHGWPVDFDTLIKAKVLDLPVLKCPSANTPKGSIDYVLGPGKGTNVAAYDRKGNHEGGRNIVTTGGEVMWLNEEAFKKRMGAQQTD